VASNEGRKDWVVILLAVGIATALNMITGAVLYAALFGHSDVPGGLSENATQILTGWGGGMIGVIGAFVGYKAGAANGTTTTPATSPTPGTTDDQSPTPVAAE
jgi:hypothetical protein